MAHDGGNGNGNGNGIVMSGIVGGTPAGAPRSEQPAPYPNDQERRGPTLRDYAAILWRRKWVILLVVVVATASAYAFSAVQTPIYEASADLIYEQDIDVENPLTGESYTNTSERSLQLSSVSSVIASPDMVARAGEILEEDGKATTGFTLTSEPVSDSETTTTTSTSNVVRITATGEDAELVAAAANAYAKAYTQWRKQSVRAQIRRAIGVIEDKLAAYGEASKESSEYLVLAQRLEDLEIRYGTTTGNFRLLVPATAPADPVEPQPLRSALLGFCVGLFAGIGLVFLLEQFDTRVRRPDEVAGILRLPILGRVPRIGKRVMGEDSLVALRHPDGHLAEALRMVRTNLDFMAVDGDVRSIVVTSCMMSEGKSVSLANLAISMAQAGKKVVVVDADMRRPRQHKLFDLPNDVGLSTVATGQTPLTDALRAIDVAPNADDGTFAAWAEGSEARSRLYVLPSGPIPPNPGEIVASRRFRGVLETLEDEADLVLVDSPAMLAVGDTSTIAALVDGLVFLVDLETIKRPQLLTAADQLFRLPTRLLGIILRMGGKGDSRYYYSPYYYYRYTDGEDGQRIRTKHRRSSREGQPTG